MKTSSNTYKKSGVNMASADKLVNYISKIARKTYKKNKENKSFKNIGSFGSIFDLSKFKGANIYKRVLNASEKYSGCTVHYVNDKLDSGKIILKKRILIEKNETENSLKTKILRQEHKLYPRSIISIFK